MANPLFVFYYAITLYRITIYNLGYVLHNMLVVAVSLRDNGYRTFTFARLDWSTTKLNNIPLLHKR